MNAANLPTEQRQAALEARARARSARRQSEEHRTRQLDRSEGGFRRRDGMGDRDWPLPPPSDSVSWRMVVLRRIARRVAIYGKEDRGSAISARERRSARRRHAASGRGESVAGAVAVDRARPIAACRGAGRCAPLLCGLRRAHPGGLEILPEMRSETVGPEAIGVPRNGRRPMPHACSEAVRLECDAGFAS